MSEPFNTLLSTAKALPIDTIVRNSSVSFSRAERCSKSAIHTRLSQMDFQELEKIVNGHRKMRNATFSDGCNIQMELGKYSVDDLRGACDHVSYQYSHRQSKQGLISDIAGMEPKLQMIIRVAAGDEKRKRESEKRERNELRQKRKWEGFQDIAIHKRRRIGEVEDYTGFMDPMDDELLKERISKFIARTNNDALRTSICSSCARERPQVEIDTVLLPDIPNSHLLKPFTNHKAHDLTYNLLLHKPRTSMGTPLPIPSIEREVQVNICKDCHQDLMKGKVPLFSLANNMWIGDIPHELHVLSLPERVLVARYFPAAHIVKLFPKAKGAKFWDTSILNSGVKGNVSTYWLDPDSIVDMLDHKNLPPSPNILAATIGVTIVGPQNLPERTLPGFLWVRRERVRRALLWLQENNPLYRDIVINQENLDLLPENDIPRQILATTRYSSDTSTLEQERSGYVVSDDDEIGDLDFISGVPIEQSDGSYEIESDVIDVAEETMEPKVHESEAPGVFTLQSLGVVDVNGSRISETDMLAHALANASDIERTRGFAVKRGSNFVNEYGRRDELTEELTNGGTSNPNHLYGAFPTLFPYGEGGFEVPRPRKVPYETHTRWALEYQDKRFRKDLHFIFQVFGVIQKRKVCSSAKLQIDKAQYRRHEMAIRRLKPLDLLKAAEEEKRKAPITNPAVRSLRELVSSLRTKVPGTDESRTGMRSQIWGLTTMKNAPSIWLTINPSDTNDPIAQVLAGEDINLREFIRTAGPNPTQRAQNVASDPFAAAKFFHYIISIVLEELLGIKVHKDRGKIAREKGILGIIEAYIGAVEAQGRGTLHLHMLLWLTGAPTPSETKRLLHTEAFRKRVAKYLSTTIKASLDDQDAETLPKRRKIKECVSYSRPINPADDEYERKARDAERDIATSVQVHECREYACLYLNKGQWVCKRRAPFELSNNDYIDEDGKWGVKRLYPYFNTWNPGILQCVRANHDIKLITNGGDTKDITWYITNYATKKQRHSFNTSALLAKRLAYHNIEERGNQDVTSVNNKLLSRCANSLTREQEFSGPEVVSYLMGWGDRFISHHFVPIYWNGVLYALKKKFPFLRKKRHPISLDQANIDHSGECLSNEEYPDAETEEQAGILEPENGELILRDQLKDYSERGKELEEYSFLDFCLNTYPEKNRVDNPKNQRVHYIEGSGRENKARIIRSPGHETMPNFIGQWFPRNDNTLEQPIYCASMMALLKPWRSLTDLQGDSFEASFHHWKNSTKKQNLDIMENIQFYHEASQGANKRRSEPNHGQPPEIETKQYAIPFKQSAPPTEDDIQIARDNSLPQRDVHHGRLAMSIAYNVGIFGDAENRGGGKMAKIPAPSDLVQYGEWNSQIQKHVKNDIFKNHVVDNTVSIHPQRVTVQTPELPDVISLEGKVRSILPTRTEAILNNEQKRAFNIIHNHLKAYLAGRKPPQLQMIIIGEGGTGKTVIINELTKLFASLGAGNMLAKTATSGVAATLISGTTLHNWAGLPMIIRRSEGWIEKASKKTKEKREKNIKPTTYLVLDEVSMCTTEVLEATSGVAGFVKRDDSNTTEAFGGINVILVGDFHQFPPPGRENLALYNRKPPTITAAVGRAIFEQFETVVILREQRRIEDASWMGILRRARTGDCTSDDIDEIRKLVVTEPDCNIPDFHEEPWSSAILVTPRHGVRNPWNEAAIERHCASTGNTLYTFDAEDTVGKDRTTLSMEQRVVIAGMREKKTARLPNRTAVTIGMKAMVTWNISTDADLANGARGEVIDIVLDPRENPRTISGTSVTLQYPPATVLFKPINRCGIKFPGLVDGLLPIFPTESTFIIESPPGAKTTITRRQLALTASYAFTDYRAQGQTIEYVIIDLGRVPSGSLSPFNAYVALSRSCGRENIRLLRDFDDKLFTTHPSNELRAEDERLENLDRVTKEKYKAGYYESWSL